MRALSVIVAVTGTLVLLGLVLFSPMLLAFAGRSTRNTDWQTISLVGQSYSFAAAILSAIAFFGVVVSLRLQRQEMRSTREQNARTLHQELIQIAIDDDQVRDVWRLLTETVTDAELKQRLYVNMVFSHWESMFQLNMMSESEVRANARSIFEHPAARYFWNISRVHRRNVAATQRAHRFIELVNIEFI